MRNAQYDKVYFYLDELDEELGNGQNIDKLSPEKLEDKIRKIKIDLN